jgi:hypothetical protein
VTVTVSANPTRRAPWSWLLLGAGAGAGLLAATSLWPSERGRQLASGVAALLLVMGSAAYGARKWFLVTRLGSLHAWMVGHVALGSALLVAVVVHANLSELGGPGWALVGLVGLQVATGLWAMVEQSLAPRRFGRLGPDDTGPPATARRRLVVLRDGVEGVLRRRGRALQGWFEERYRPVLDGRSTRLPPLQGFPPADARVAEELHGRVAEIARLGPALARLERTERASMRWSWIHVPATVALVTMVVLHVIGWLAYG